VCDSVTKQDNKTTVVLRCSGVLLESMTRASLAAPVASDFVHRVEGYVVLFCAEESIIRV
jgi:hypothetical protein